ncbi:hypothetical protein C7T94_05940 [Pedobacter yulinensis]|uniref:Peptidase S8/S53 domain-containing protein n=1 Tax=Pedobacter yulinensis TaxID=2126353 RepID=A0A2T3HP75_9SPHI|nr:S8 family serine peptidase [Pedobacter yulinensis]PST84260.1 hypothetical protein C7T94_05940 [Pedobacter yulinensis]
MIRIGMIDSGADATHRLFRHAQVSGLTRFWTARGPNVLDDVFTDAKGHGTGVLSVLRQYAPDAAFVVVKPDSATGIVTEHMLLEAMQYLVDRGDIDLINISMGVKKTVPSKEMLAICRQAKAQNITIVAADHHAREAERLCFPAHVPGVYGVRVGLTTDGDRFNYLGPGLNMALAKGDYKKVAAPGDKYFMAYGTSFAAASFTGIITRARLQEHWQNDESLKAWLQRTSDPAVLEQEPEQSLQP